jgi:hypothetical protein
MSEFMLIMPGNDGSPDEAAAAKDPAVIRDKLLAALHALDEIGASIPAAHVSMAIDQLRIQFNLAEDGSGTD